MVKELKIVKVIGYSVYPVSSIEKSDIEKYKVKVVRHVFDCKDTGKSYVVLSPEDKQELSSQFSLYNGIIPKDRCEKAFPHYSRYDFDERMHMFTVDFDNEYEFVEREIDTYYAERCAELEKDLERIRDIRARALDCTKKSVENLRFT